MILRRGGERISSCAYLVGENFRLLETRAETLSVEPVWFILRSGNTTVRMDQREGGRRRVGLIQTKSRETLI